MGMPRGYNDYSFYSTTQQYQQQQYQQYQQYQQHNNSYFMPSTSTTKLSNDLPFDTWWPIYSKALFIISRSFDPQDATSLKSIKVFFNSLMHLLPNEQARKCFQSFIGMKSSVVDTLAATIPNIFVAYPWLENLMRTNAKEFHNLCFRNQDQQALFVWIYLCYVYMTVCLSSSTKSTVSLPTINELRAQFHPEKITKTDWGTSLWFILHTCSLYAPEPMETSFLHYKNLLASLQYLIPCPKCRKHLQQNLQYIDLDSCDRTANELFKCSWKLHNIVNVSDNKPQIPLQQALALYTF
jgi:hypothetical protein